VQRFRETFEVPQRANGEAVDRTALTADYQYRRQRVMDIFDDDMEGFGEVVSVVRERHDVERQVRLHPWQVTAVKVVTQWGFTGGQYPRCGHQLQRGQDRAGARGWGEAQG
jgi:hypothetical protein